MTTTGRTVESTTAALESAGFVRVVSRADGDALAASGVLARALAERGTPFQVSVAATVDERTGRVDAERDEAERTVVVGASDADARHVDPTDRPATLVACEIAGDLDVRPDPVLALAGAFAAGVEPGAGETEWLLETATERGLVESGPGVAVPTDDPVDGLAHSTLLRAPWSGDREATADALALDPAADPGLDGDGRRRLASLVALDAVGDDDASERAAHEIARVLGPLAAPSAPFATVGGFADVLAATARAAPGTGVALAMGHDARDAALEVWRDHGRRAHEALDAAATGRYDGLFVVGIEDGPVETVARLAADYRSPEPATLAIGDGEAAVATTDGRSLAAPMEAVARDLEAEYDVGRRRGYLRYDPELEDGTIVAAAREVL